MNKTAWIITRWTCWLLLAAFLGHRAHADTNLAVICTTCKPGDLGDTGTQKYGIAKPTDLVRVCGATCVRGPSFVWAVYSTLAPGSHYDSCTTDIPIDTPSPSPWSAAADPCKAWAAATVGGTPAAPQSVILTWVAPTQNTDTTPLTDLAGFELYRDNALIQTLNNPALTTYTDSVAPGTYSYTAKAFNAAGIRSDFSAAVSVTKTAPALKPNPPSDIAVPFATTSAVVYRIVQNIDSVALAIVGNVPVGTTCDPVQSIALNGVTYSRVNRASITWSSNWRPSVVFSPCS